MTYYHRLAVQRIKDNGLYPDYDTVKFIEQKFRYEERVYTEELFEEDDSVHQWTKDWDIMENYFEQREAIQAVQGK